MGVLLACFLTDVTPQVISGSLNTSHDSDSFDERTQTLGFTGGNGWGVRVGAMHYAAPDWSANGKSLEGTYKIDSAQRKVDATFGIASIAKQNYVVGALEYLQQLQIGTSLGLGIERNAVNSQLGLQQGIFYNALILVADHSFNDRFSVGVGSGITAFSNHNQRPILRTRWTYSLNEKYGLNAFLKTRSYQNSNPHRPEYFSPDHLHEASLGLSVRVAVADNVALNASLDTGRQRIDGNSQTIWSAVLGLGSGRASKMQWKVGIEATNSASVSTSQAAVYRYITSTARVSIPW